MPLFLLIALIGIPMLEIYLFIRIGGAIGAGGTILLIFLTAFIGLTLIRRQGLAVWLQARSRYAQGEPPLTEAAHGIFLLLAGVLLLTPGFATDTLGFLLLWSPMRRFLVETLLEALLIVLFGQGMAWARGQGNKPDTPDIIEGDYWTHDGSEGSEGSKGNERD